MPQPPLAENKYGHGAKPINALHRAYRKLRQPFLGRASIPFDWSKGFDIESTVTLTRKDQGTSSSCSGQAGSSFLEGQRKIGGMNEVLSAKSIYAPIAYKGGGTTVSALETQIAAHGANLEATVPSTPSIESFLEDKSWVTDSLNLDALKRAGYTPYRIPKNMDSIAEAIRDYGGVIIELTGQNNGTWLSPYPAPPAKPNPNPLWFHFMYFKGATMINGNKKLAGLNSWGTSVGSNGVQFFGEEYLKYFLEVSSFVKDAELQPIPDSTSIWAAIALWFKSLVFNTQP